MKKFIQLFVLALISMIQLGCATKEGSKSVYQSIQNMKKFDCNTILVQSQYKECMERSQVSFEEYDRAREELIKK